MDRRSSINGETKGVIRSSNLDPKFAQEIMEHPGGEKLLLCYQCGACTGSCPVGKITEQYKPRRIIRMAMLGLRREVLSNNSIWLCASCYTCQERCSQGVEIADLMLAIRNIAFREGYAPKALVDQAVSLIESGRLMKISGSSQRQRAVFGLPSIPPTSEEILMKIVATTGFDKLIEKLRG